MDSMSKIMNDMVNGTARYAKSHGLLKEGMHVLVACSGGPDSLALLDILMKLRPRFHLVLSAAHFDHGIRGQVSAEDAAFVAAFCRERDIPCFSGRASVPEAAAERGQSLELAARELRYDFLWQTLQRIGADVLATAHHADDQAETVLMRILRGTGLDGLSAMLPRSGRHIRPLLFARRCQIEAYCRAEGLEPRHDATNDIPDCTRNLLRLEVLPYLRQRNPEISQMLCQLAELARVDSDFLEQQLAELWPYITGWQEGEYGLRLESFRRHHPALQRRALRRLFRETAGNGQDLGFAHVEKMRWMMLKGPQTGKSLELPGGVTAHFGYTLLTMTKEAKEAKERASEEGRQRQTADFVLKPKIPGTVRWQAYQIEARLLAERPVATGPAEYYLDFDAVNDSSLLFRTRRSGDFMELPAGHKKIKDILIDDKVPREKRDELLLLADGSEILWLVGKRRSRRYPVTEHTKNILYFHIQRKEETT